MVWGMDVNPSTYSILHLCRRRFPHLRVGEQLRLPLLAAAE
jgi:hypothetical protein